MLCSKTTVKYEMMYVITCNTADYGNKISLKHGMENQDTLFKSVD